MKKQIPSIEGGCIATLMTHAGTGEVLRLPRRGARVTTEMVRQLMDEEGI